MHFRYLILFNFPKKRKSCINREDDLITVYGYDVIAERLLFVGGLLLSEVDILIWNIENLPADLQSLTMMKSKC